MTVQEKLQSVRVELQELKLKPSGNNTYSKFTYFELKDFLPAVNKLFQAKKLFSKTSLFFDRKGKEFAKLRISNAEKLDDYEEWIVQTAEVSIGKKDGSGGAQPIQNLGGKITYMRRYLFLLALEIIEPDFVDNINQELNKEIEEADLEKINKAKTLKELAEVCGELKKKYKISLITPLYEQAKIKLEQTKSKA